MAKAEAIRTFVLFLTSCYAVSRRQITMTANIEHIQNGDYLILNLTIPT